MNITKWNVLGDEKHRAPVGVLCRWIMHDQLMGLIEYTEVSNECGLPKGSEGGSQMPRAWRLIQEGE